MTKTVEWVDIIYMYMYHGTDCNDITAVSMVTEFIFKLVHNVHVTMHNIHPLRSKFPF